ncbi:serine-threonine/tyrosine-protein kinase catalytic domain-containing protein [Tanacetum coccineum]
MENLSRDHWTPYLLSEREVTKAIDTVFSLFGESTNGEIGLTCDGMLRFYDNGADVLHDHFEFLRLDYKPFDDNEDSFQTTERFGKVKRIFQRFDMNQNGYLDKLELACFLEIYSPDQETELQLLEVKNIFHLYSGFIEGDKGLNCDGLFKLYGSGIESVEYYNLNQNLQQITKMQLQYSQN